MSNVRGLVELNAMLQTLSVKVEKNIIRGALRAGAKVILAEAKANVPVKSGVLRDGLKISTGSKGGRITAKVKATGKHASIAHLVEYSTAAHHILPKDAKSLFFGGTFAEGVDHPGTTAKPFLRPALDSQAGAATVAVGEYIKSRLTKAGLDQAGEVEVKEE